jgi:hypothetical protein
MSMEGQVTSHAGTGLLWTGPRDHGSNALPNNVNETLQNNNLTNQTEKMQKKPTQVKIQSAH